MNSVVIVESPAKSRTINKILGKDFIVKASIGHIRDLVEGELGVDVNNNFQPKYEVPAEKKKVVAELKKIVKGADVVWLATDEDREGEAIAWHLSEVLGLSENKTRRITYSEITKDAIQKAIKRDALLTLKLRKTQFKKRLKIREQLIKV